MSADDTDSTSANLLASQWAQDYNPLDFDLQNPWTHLNDIGTLNESHFPFFNDTQRKVVLEHNCSLQYKNQPSFEYCNASSDSILCWPPTRLNTTAVLKCFSELYGIKYDDTQNASRQCLWNGTWSKTDYSLCTEVAESNTEGIVTTSTIYFAGYSLSLVALTVAIGIFICFKDLRCLRNTIHMNLMCAYVLVYFMWILTLVMELSVQSNMVSCVFLIILLHYFHITTFFWMFVEGLYLYILVVETLTRENFKLRIYVCIGWGLPIVIITIWTIVKSFMPIVIETNIDDWKMESSQLNAENLWRHCPWMKPHSVDWIHQSPVLLVLLLNLLFLAAIMWVLITKLRSANTLETQQYRKAAKALLVLMPLLGVTYVLTIAGPTDGPTKNLFDYTRAVLLSTQGFTVALFYCFLNTEVQNTLRHHLDNWKATRNLGTRRMRNDSRSKDCSPRSESIRFTEWTVISVTSDDNSGGQAVTTYEKCNGK